MAFQSIWYQTDLPVEIIELIEKECAKSYDSELVQSSVLNSQDDFKKRNSKNAWISTDSWIAGFLWHYINKANRENFLYDLTNIDNETIQYTSYGEGEFYGWHEDATLPLFYKAHSGNDRELLIQDSINKQAEHVRKLSFSVQLSSPDDYEGGNLQLMDDCGKLYYAPRRRGSVVLFDSRTRHRVLKVTKGKRKSLVGWVVGPRWK